MKVFLLCLLLTVARSDSSKDRKKIPEPRYPIAAAVNTFGAQLLVEYRNKHPNTSVVFSPFSIASAFYLLYRGAKGETAKELEDLFQFQERQVQKGLSQDNFKSSSVALANRVYVEKSVSINKSYTKSIGRRRVRKLRFVKSPKRSRKRINRWVQKKTAGFIKDLLSSGSIDASTVLVIVNALYFQGTWARPFPIQSTAEGIFNGIYGKETVPFMQRKDVTLMYKTVKELDGSMVILPYKRDDYAMYIFIPNKRDGWKKAEKRFPEYAGSIFDRGFSNQMVDRIRLPKWEMETQLPELVDLLIGLGISNTLSAKADFGGISKTKPIAVSDVAHKAKIVVDEEVIQTVMSIDAEVCLGNGGGSGYRHHHRQKRPAIAVH